MPSTPAASLMLPLVRCKRRRDQQFLHLLEGHARRGAHGLPGLALLRQESEIVFRELVRRGRSPSPARRRSPARARCPASCSPSAPSARPRRSRRRPCPARATAVPGNAAPAAGCPRAARAAAGCGSRSRSAGSTDRRGTCPPPRPAADSRAWRRSPARPRALPREPPTR